MNRIRTIGIIGGGHMGEALLAGILKKRLVSKGRLSVVEVLRARQRFLKKRYGVSVTDDSRKIAWQSQILILAVKPQQMGEVLKTVAPLPKNCLVISIAAGVRLSFLERYLGSLPMVRVMPNLAAAVGEAISALAKGRHAKRGHAVMAEKIFRSVGDTVWVAESKLDAVTALSGSGPAYVASFMKALSEGAPPIGLPKRLALRLVQKTFEGSVAYLSEKGIDPETFVKRVASKGGTTEAALKVFQKRRLSETVALALRRATERSRQLSRG